MTLGSTGGSTGAPARVGEGRGRAGPASPLVTIGVPVFNEERTIEAALDVLLAQDHANLEILVSDNASTDGSAAICSRVAARNPRVRVWRNERNLGSIANFAILGERARGEYFMWASAHDVHAPSFVSRCLEPLEADPAVVLAYPLAHWVDADGDRGADLVPLQDTRHLDRLSRLQAVLWTLGYAYPIYGLIRTAALRRLDLRWVCLGQDQVHLAELALLGTFACVGEHLLGVRHRPADGWAQMLHRCTARRVSPLEAEWLLARMVLGQLRAVFRSRVSLSGACLASLTVLTSFVGRRRRLVPELWRSAAAYRRQA